jgi:tRNA A37 threonylcarbamoyladenosine dehydratase
MRMHPFQRTELLLGQDGFAKLQGTRAAVIGLGGVGSYAAEALARSGVGQLTLVDFDRVCVTNLNRQIHANRGTVNQLKAELMAERVRAINPKCDVIAHATFFDRHTEEMILAPGFDFVIDCIDNMTAKIHLITACVKRDIPVWASMGAGGKLDPTRIRVTDISKTRNDPFARIARDLLRQKGITAGVSCVWSDELPHDLDQVVQAGFRCICPGKDENQVNNCENRHQVQGSVSWMPAMFGLALAGAAINRHLGVEMGTGVVETVPRTKPSPHRVSRARRAELMASVVERGDLGEGSATSASPTASEAP